MEYVEDDKDDVFADLNQLNKNLGNLDERGLVLSLAAFSEDSLGKMLARFMLKNKASKELIEGFNAPLGTFSSRIKACFSLGLIDEKQYKDLEILRKVRNKFSHSWENVSLDDDVISAQIINLNFSRIDFDYQKNNYERIKKSISSLLIELKIVTKQIKEKSQGVKLIGAHVNIGFAGNDFDKQLSDIWQDVEKIEIDINSSDKKLSAFSKHKAELLIDRLPYFRFDFSDLDKFSSQLGDIMELRNGILKAIGSDEYRIMSEEEKNDLRKNLFSGLRSEKN
ncbi:MltR family transcriptional regulator [Pantoea sp. USHLN256]|uniref:MltR family transcriptional regulator n=1 Tax=Pantoea sp. USHLN256 TaxID=3081293 RepID=UPI00301678B0